MRSGWLGVEDDVLDREIGVVSPELSNLNIQISQEKAFWRIYAIRFIRCTGCRNFIKGSV